MKEPNDAEKYQVGNQQPMQGQIVGEGNVVHNYYSQRSHAPASPATPPSPRQQSRLVPTILLLLLLVLLLGGGIAVSFRFLGDSGSTTSKSPNPGGRLTVGPGSTTLPTLPPTPSASTLTPVASTYPVTSPSPTTNSSTTFAAQLPSGAVLKPGMNVISPNTRYSLIMGNDGNLVLYDLSAGSPGKVLWSSGTAGQRVDYCIMQNDGNLVILGFPDPIWSSQTYGHPGAFLQVQDDGNVVIIQAGVLIWNTNTG